MFLVCISNDCTDVNTLEQSFFSGKSVKIKYIIIRGNVKRVHFQACIWKAALQQDPPKLHPLELVGHQVHIAQRHFQAELQLSLQIYLS